MERLSPAASAMGVSANPSVSVCVSECGRSTPQQAAAVQHFHVNGCLAQHLALIDGEVSWDQFNGAKKKNLLLGELIKGHSLKATSKEIYIFSKKSWDTVKKHQPEKQSN